MLKPFYCFGLNALELGILLKFAVRFMQTSALSSVCVCVCVCVCVWCGGRGGGGVCARPCVITLANLPKQVTSGMPSEAICRRASPRPRRALWCVISRGTKC